MRTLLIYMLFIASIVLSHSGNTTQAADTPGFVENWTYHHTEALAKEPSGTYAIFDLEHNGTYLFMVNDNGNLKAVRFRHDKNEVPVYGSTIEYGNYSETVFSSGSIYAAKIEDLLVPSDNLGLAHEKRLRFKGSSIQLAKPISQKAIIDATRAHGKELKEKKWMMVAQPWRKHAIAYLTKHFTETNYKCEIKNLIEDEIYDIENDSNYQEFDFHIFRVLLEKTPYTSKTLAKYK